MQDAGHEDKGVCRDRGKGKLRASAPESPGTDESVITLGVDSKLAPVTAQLTVLSDGQVEQKEINRKLFAADEELRSGTPKRPPVEQDVQSEASYSTRFSVGRVVGDDARSGSPQEFAP
eukprot:5165569-Pyramimonas_sp.AAC.1